MDWKDKMSKSVLHLEEQLRGIRPGSLSVGFIETFKVPYYGSLTPLSQLAAITTRQDHIHITPYDRGLVATIAHTLEEGKLNAYQLNPTTVCVSVPPMSGEQREDVAAHIRKLGEEAKIAVRSIRHSVRKTADRSEDKSIQKVTDEKINLITALVGRKIEELG